MASVLNLLARLGRAITPHGYYMWKERRERALREPPGVAPEILALLQANAGVKDRHRGERCFILGNGPSVKALDLTALKGQTVISVSNGYLHQAFGVFAPRYHCLPQVTYSDKMTKADTVVWFKEMHERLGDAELFLSTQEEPLVREHGLFAGRVVRYLDLTESFDEVQGSDIIDLTQPVPRVESVPVMALMIALYAGFREIVLLGVDHDHFLTGRYDYAFRLGVQEGKGVGVDQDGVVITLWHDEFQSLARLWRQYRCLSRIAKANAVTIVNATPGGALDEFPRNDLQSLLNNENV